MMAKVALALLAGGFLIAGVLLLAVPFVDTLTLPSDCCPSSAIWGGEPGTEPPPPPPSASGMVRSVDCGPPVSSNGPTVYFEGGFYGFPVCGEPIRNRRIAAGISLACGVVAAAAWLRLVRRPDVPESEAVPSPSH